MAVRSGARAPLPLSQAQLMFSRVLVALVSTLTALLAASPAFAQLSLRGDYAASRGITEISALYAKQTKTTVVVSPFSTVAGIDGVLSGEIDIATSARPPVASRAAEKDLVFWPVAWDALVFIVHPSNPVTNLTLGQVRDIFQGKLDNWKDVGGKDAPIDLYSVIGPYDGLESSMRSILFANPGYRAKIDRLFLNQHQIEVGIQMDPDAIGMTTLAGLSKQKVKPLAIEGINADKDSITDGRYLLTVPLYLVYRADGPKATQITEFAQFLRTPAVEAEMVKKRLVPHREDDDFKAIHTQRLATVWERLGGQPIPPEQLRLTSTGNGAAATGAVAANGTAVATAGTAETAAPVSAAPVAATAAVAGEGVTATQTQSAAADASVADGAAVAAGNDGEEAGCKKRWFSRKC